MVPLKEKLNFNPGQFVFVTFKNKKLTNESHPFSISSSTNEKELKIAIKTSGDYTKTLKKNLSLGTIAKVEGPFGIFTYKNKKPDQIWIAGGIGITPFISMLKEMATTNNQTKIDLYYCIHNEKEGIYLDVLQNLNENINLIPYYSDGNKHINANYIINNSQNVEHKDILICAPVKMIQSLKTQLINKGIKKESIYSEEFAF